MYLNHLDGKTPKRSVHDPSKNSVKFAYNCYMLANKYFDRDCNAPEGIVPHLGGS